MMPYCNVHFKPAEVLKKDETLSTKFPYWRFLRLFVGVIFTTTFIIAIGPFSLSSGKFFTSLDTYDVDFSPNINVLQWLPQNDLLGHPKTKLFISHVGQNSMLEACYHGVPVLAVPLGVDQVQNAILISERTKMGDQLDIAQVNEEDWFQTIQGILSNESYAINAKRVSRRMRSKKKSPIELTGDLIEYVIDNDYDMSHLKSRGPELPWHVVNLYDVYTFLLLVIIVVLLFVYSVSRKCLHVLFARKRTGY